MFNLKPADFAAVIISLCAVFISGYFVYSDYSPPELLEITSDAGRMVYPLGNDRLLDIDGPLGSSKIVIRDKSAWFEDSPCPDKLCVKSGHLHDSGDWAGCLPNRVFIRIRGKEDENEKIDALSF